MPEENDWRLGNQLSYLKGAEIAWREYRAYRPGWEHDHCEFCWAEFAEGGDPDVLHAGFATADEYRWICRSCFEDFRERFAWRVLRKAP